jgi:hypothetical protein
VSLDYLIYGGFCLRIVKYKSKTQLYHIDFGKIRVQKTESSLEEPKEYYFSDDWNTGNKPKIITFPAYGEVSDEKLGSLLYVKDYSSLNEYYPIPDYFGAVKSIIGEIESQNYLVNVMDNSYLPRNIIKMKQTFTPEEEIKLKNKLDESFKGIENAGKPMILTNMQDVDSVTVEQLDYAVVDSNFEMLDSSLTQKIISSHRIPQILATTTSANGFSNGGEELRVAFEVFYKTVISESQSMITNVINKLTDKTVEILPLDIIKTQLSEQTLASILTVDEMREQYGFSKLPSNQQTNG